MAGLTVSVSARPRLRDLLEVLLAYGLILAVIWTTLPWQRYFYWLAILCIVGLTLLQREKLHASGLAPDRALRSFWIVAAAMVLAGLAVVIAALMGTLHALPSFGRLSLRVRIGGYLLWAFLQEFIVQVYMLMRLIRLLPRRWMAIAIAAVLFAVAHIPNPVLMWLTLLWGGISCAYFLRYRNLYALGLAHGILGLCIAMTVPDALQHHMRVGLGYLHYHPRHQRIHRSSAPHIVSTEAWVIAEAATLRSERQARP